MAADPGEQPQEVADRHQAEVAALRRSRRRLAEAAYADRRAIERDLHDGVQQHLVALGVDLQRLARMVDRDPVAAKGLVNEMAANVREALDETTELAHRIHPLPLGQLGFATALRSAAQAVGVTAIVDIAAGADYPPETVAALYWCCVDALSSASGGSTATVTTHDTEGALTFEILIAEPLTGDRIERLRDRIEALDGRLSVDVRQDGGARVHGWLPLSD